MTKYIKSTEYALETIRVLKSARQLDEEKVRAVVDLAKSYMKDAKFYLGSGRLETALSSIAYCEGLLDALRLLGVAELRWSKAEGE